MDEYKEAEASQGDKAKAEKHVNASDIHHRKNDQEQNKSDSQVPDVLGLQSLELDGLIDALVDAINTRCHNEALNTKK